MIDEKIFLDAVDEYVKIFEEEIEREKAEYLEQKACQRLWKRW